MVSTRRRPSSSTKKKKASTKKKRSPSKSPVRRSTRASSSSVSTRSSSGGFWAAWQSPNDSKRHGEAFFLRFSCVWILAVAAVVYSRVFEQWRENEYMAFAVSISAPFVVWPLLFPGPDAALPWHARWTTKANVWIFIMAYVANHVWTHYFYKVLGCKYTFPAHRFNDVPICLYLMTHSYFAFYHALSNAVLRRAWRLVGNKATPFATLFIVILTCALAYAMAFGETFSIQHFPYYEIADRYAMYTVGSVFYALYFLASFPLFLRWEEKGERRSLGAAALDGMACCMIITLLLDFWRILVGPISGATEAGSGMPFVFVATGEAARSAAECAAACGSACAGVGMPS